MSPPDAFFEFDMLKHVYNWGFAPDPEPCQAPLGAYSAPPDPLPGLRVGWESLAKGL